ncbi:MAG: agmatine deiminase family protein [Pseudomonadota bacterium]
MLFDRRAFTLSLGGVIGLLANGAAGAARAPAGRVPGQWEATDAIWLSADVKRPEYMEASARMMTALAPHVPLRLLVKSKEDAELARDGLDARGVAMGRVPIHEHHDVGYFIREAALFAQDGSGRKAVVDFDWNTYGLADWCATYLYPDRPSQAKACADYAAMNKGVVDRWFADRTGATSLSIPIVLEGGAYEFNGRGVVLVSAPLTLQRNRGRTLDELERILLTLPGIRKVIWLKEGLVEDPHLKSTITGNYVGIGTGGHLDEYVRFANSRTILLAWVEDHEIDHHPLNAINRERMAENFALLSAARDQDGRPFRIIKTPLPRIIERQETIVEKSADDLVFSVGSFPKSEGRKAGDTVTRVAAASYLNFLICNKMVLLPTYEGAGTPKDVENKVRRLFADAFPGREIKFIDVTAINWGGGGIHCATLSEMRQA